ncbi:hypothetical protein TWF281_007731 [Arthrobotrys megalospora]
MSNTKKPLPPLPGPPTSISKPISLFTQTPQPHYHRVWHRKCLHRNPTVTVPLGQEVEYDSSSRRYTRTNNHRLCMCDSSEEYYFEEVEVVPSSGRYVEQDIVEEFWRLVDTGGSSSSKNNNNKKKKENRVSAEFKAVVKGVLEVVGGKDEGEKKKKKKKGERKRVVRWVPRWRRVEGECRGCSGEGTTWIEV